MPSMRFNALLDTSHHGPPHPLKDAEVIAESLKGTHNAMANCVFFANRSCADKGF
jgi:hypothetical protein